LLGDPESRRYVSISLGRIADIEASRGDVDAALAKYQEALEIRRSLG
jgi:predicted negative regulator of RcsB-dependent stress response